MDDDYVKVFVWRGGVTSLPEPMVLVRESVPIVGRIIKRALTRALHPVQIATYFLERYAGNVLVDVRKRFNPFEL